MVRIRMLATKNIWPAHDHIGGEHSQNVEWLETLWSLMPPPARPPWRPALAGTSGRKPHQLRPRARALQQGAAGQPTPPQQATEQVAPEHHKH